MGVYEHLQARGLIAQVTDEAEVRELVNNGKATFYIGFDPTADSLHAGHLLQLIVMRHLQLAGNRPIALLGCGTTMIGDPSGRTDMRQMLSMKDIECNAARFKVQMERFLDFSEGKAIMLNNADWLMELNYVELLREVGAHFSVNRMLSAECYQNRMERGLTFLEFNYMIMQSYDFYAMFKSHGCRLQCGGNDQWSNILAGTELIRKKTSENGKAGEDAYGLTFTLLLTSDGRKMGKTQKGALWLDPEKTSPYEFYQYWRNVEDADVLKCLRMITFLPLEQIAEMERLEGSELNRAKELLAFELTRLVHGGEEASKAQDASRALFSSGGSLDGIPTTELAPSDFTDGAIGIIDLLIKCGLTASRSEARRAVEQGGVEAGGEKIAEFGKTFPSEAFAGDGLVLKRGKKSYNRAVLG